MTDGVRSPDASPAAAGVDAEPQDGPRRDPAAGDGEAPRREPEGGARDRPDWRPGTENNAAEWPQFRGPGRNGRVAWLPEALPGEGDRLWTAALPSDGFGGVCVAGGLAVVGSRDAADVADVWTAHNLAKGEPRWTFRSPRPLTLDYGNSPRATPAYADGLLVVMGAGGSVHALDAEAGLALWSAELTERFAVEAGEWGFGGSPLVLGERVIVSVGGGVRMAALDLLTGETVWASEGPGLPHASPVAVERGDRTLLAGVGGEGVYLLDAADGSLAWEHRPDYFEEFGVPSAVRLPGGLLFAGENTGVRRFGLDDPSGPAAVNEFVTPDAHTPVLAGGVVLAAFEGLKGLDPATLEERWAVAAGDVRSYASVIASEDRTLVTTEAGVQLLVAFDGASARVLDRREVASVKTLSHPAVAGGRLVTRVGRELRCERLRSVRGRDGG